MITESNLKTKLRTENTAWFLIRQWVRLFLACFIAALGSYQQMMSAICRLGQWFWGEIVKAYILKGGKGSEIAQECVTTYQFETSPN